MRQINNVRRHGNSVFEHLSEKSIIGKCHICACCKRIVTQSGVWEEVESHLFQNPVNGLSTVVCLSCVKKRFPHEYDALFPEKLMD